MKNFFERSDPQNGDKSAGCSAMTKIPF